MRIYKLIEASGYTSETSCRVYKTKAEAIKVFKAIFEASLLDGCNIADEDVLDKTEIVLTNDMTEKQYNRAIKLYKLAVINSLHFRYDSEVINEVWIERQYI